MVSSVLLNLAGIVSDLKACISHYQRHGNSVSLACGISANTHKLTYFTNQTYNLTTSHSVVCLSMSLTATQICHSTTGPHFDYIQKKEGRGVIIAPL